MERDASQPTEAVATALRHRPGTATAGGVPTDPADVGAGTAGQGGRHHHHRHHRARWVLTGAGVVLVAAGATFAYLWTHSGAHALPTSVAIERFRQEVGPAGAGNADGPAAGVYRYQGSGTETLSVPPKSQSEGPGVPGTVVYRDGCFDFRLDYSDAHWQSWDYCVRGGALVSPSRAGYYNWDFVAFHADDTSTFTCRPSVTAVPAAIVKGRSARVACTGRNNHLATGKVFMDGTSTVARTGTIPVGNQRVPAVLVREHVTFSGGQSGSNLADTWFDVTTGLPLKGTWHTDVSTPSPFGTSTLDAHGDFALSSLTPIR